MLGLTFNVAKIKRVPVMQKKLRFYSNLSFKLMASHTCEYISNNSAIKFRVAMSRVDAIIR